MASRTFQLCIVFAIGVVTGSATASTALSPGGGIAGASSTSINTISTSNPGPVAAGGTPGTTTLPGGEIVLSLHVGDPRDVTVARGQGAQLRCPVNDSSGPRGISITWLHNGRPVYKNDTRRQIQEDGSLYIRKVAGKRINSTEGSYSCLVKNKHGEIVTNSAKLRMAVLAKDFMKQPEDARAEISQPFVLSCQIQSVPTAVIIWERDRNSLPHSTKYVLLPSGDLLISSIQPSDAGSYRCKALNEISQKHRFSAEASITTIATTNANRGPRFVILRQELNLTAHVGADLPLYCFASGNPRPNIRWNNNADLQTLSNSSILWLRNLTADHSGIYVCSAQNSVGYVKQYFLVNVVQAPYFVKSPVSQWFPSARTVRLDCKAEGIPQPVIHWLKDGEPLAIGGRVKELSSSGLLLSHTFTRDSGLYQCVAENEYGRIWSPVQLIANGSSEIRPPMNVRCTSYNTTSICLQWDAPPGLGVNAYSVHSFTAGNLDQEYITNKTFYLISKLEPYTNYTFYIRLYLKAQASDPSNNLTCQTALKGIRNFKFKPLSNSTLRVDWTSLSNDVPCGGSAEYKLQWRKFGHSSNIAKLCYDTYYTITGLTPSQKYEIRVQTPMNEDEELPWMEYIMSSNLNNTAIDSTDSDSIKTVMAPINLEAEPASPFKINLTWSDARKMEDVQLGGYYMICYTEVKSQQNCENGDFAKSITTSFQIYNLTPYTLYEFKVRAHNLDGSYGQFSHSIECRTLEHVPQQITNLIGKVDNISSICLRWKKPNIVNGQLQKYVISYSYSNQSLEHWSTVILPADQAMLHSCWRSSADTVSMNLKSLPGGKSYRVVVRAATNAGLSPPSDQIILKLPSTSKPLPEDELQNNQKLGIIVGVCIALMVIVACISCMIFRRRCLKARARERARMYITHSTNGQSATCCQPSSQPVDGAVVESSCPPLALERRHCDAEAHELQYLVSDAEAHIPPLEQQSHLDTKGGVSYPNGQLNGLKYLPNGHVPSDHVHITENPQYEPYVCNGYNGTSESHQLLEENSNLSRDDSLLDDRFNSTQLTSLDESVASSRALPVLGPNG